MCGRLRWRRAAAAWGHAGYQMNNKLQFRRALLLLGLLGAAFAGLGYRLVDLQVVRHDELSFKAQKNTQREFRQQPRRGDILDVNGDILATSVPVKTVCADPTLIGTQALAVAQVIAPLLQLNEAAIAQRLTPRTYVTKNSDGQTVTNDLHYVRLARNVMEPLWQRVAAAMSNFTYDTGGRKLSRKEAEWLRNLQLHGIYAESDQLRVYPNGSLAAQVIGFPGLEETNVSGHYVSKIVGRDGIERALDGKLSGVAGWRVTETDKERREVVALRDEDVYARDGLNVVLTIDSAVQHIVETALAEAWQQHAPKSVTGIVMRPRTGEILALASLPNYDPNQPGTILPGTQNRVVSEVMEPGSTFKIVVVSGALNSGVVKLTDEFDCEHGQFRFANRLLHDHKAFGMLTTESIITKSSNIGAAKIGIRLGADNLYRYAWEFGFGQYTGIPLPGEVRGILHPVKDWSKVSIAQIPMGQGLAVTRLQMLYAMGAIANGGWLMEPMIVSRLQDHDRSIVERYTPQRVRQVITEETSKQMIEALKTVVTKEGTAPEAALKDYVVAGKTGTAQKAEKGGYASDKFFSSFIGFFPADDPELCISVVMDEPKEGHFGGEVCGPVFRDIAERCASYLNIPPDPSLIATNTPPLAAGSNASSQKETAQ
ncbi:MAG TPA: penicillin-binding protein 2 [Candidatus Acidoferrales bacterium]|nr:penicillin-binding protein 2 [Candidatus Acidoferrales bacterium]